MLRHADGQGQGWKPDMLTEKGNAGLFLCAPPGRTVRPGLRLVRLSIG